MSQEHVGLLELRLHTAERWACLLSCKSEDDRRCFWRETRPALGERSEGQSKVIPSASLALCFVHIQILTQSAAHPHAQSNKRPSVRLGSIRTSFSGDGANRKELFFALRLWPSSGGRSEWREDFARTRRRRRMKQGLPEDHGTTHKARRALGHFMQVSLWESTRSCEVARPLD